MSGKQSLGEDFYMLVGIIQDYAVTQELSNKKDASLNASRSGLSRSVFAAETDTDRLPLSRCCPRSNKERAHNRD